MDLPEPPDLKVILEIQVEQQVPQEHLVQQVFLVTPAVQQDQQVFREILAYLVAQEVQVPQEPQVHRVIQDHLVARAELQAQQAQQEALAVQVLQAQQDHVVQLV